MISGLVATDLEGPDPLTDDGTPLCSQPYSPTHRSEEPLIAAHAWDTHGAHQAGLTTGWVARLEDAFPAIYAPPDVTGQDLVEVVSGLLDLRPD